MTISFSRSQKPLSFAVSQCVVNQPKQNVVAITYTETPPEGQKQQVRLLKVLAASCLGILGYGLSPQLHGGLKKLSARAGQKISLKAIQWPMGLLGIGSFMALFPMSMKHSNQYTQRIFMTNVDLNALKNAGTLSQKA